VYKKALGFLLSYPYDKQKYGGTHSEQDLYADGFKKACPSPNETGEWTEYPTCFVQIEPAEEEVE